MNFKAGNLLYYVLIMLLMIAPLRNVVAVPCDMEVMGNMQGMHEVSNHGVMPVDTTMSERDGAAMQSADIMHHQMSKHCCCNDCDVNCAGDCDFGISFSLLLHEINYSPVYQAGARPFSPASKILFRELTPPSRPPATLHS